MLQIEEWADCRWWPEKHVPGWCVYLPQGGSAAHPRAPQAVVAEAVGTLECWFACTSKYDLLRDLWARHACQTLTWMAMRMYWPSGQLRVMADIERWARVWVWHDYLPRESYDNQLAVGAIV